jgi:hypothetical protein
MCVFEVLLGSIKALQWLNSLSHGSNILSFHHLNYQRIPKNMIFAVSITVKSTSHCLCLAKSLAEERDRKEVERKSKLMKVWPNKNASNYAKSQHTGNILIGTRSMFQGRKVINTCLRCLFSMFSHLQIKIRSWQIHMIKTKIKKGLWGQAFDSDSLSLVIVLLWMP